MAGVAAAVDAVVSKLEALLLLQDDDGDDHHRRRRRRKLSRGDRRSAAFIRDALRAARDLVTGLSAEEDRNEQRRHMSRHGHRQMPQIAHLMGNLDELVWAIDPSGRYAPGYCSRKLRDLCYDTEHALDALALRVAAGTPPPSGLFSSFRGAGNRWAMTRLSFRVAVKVGSIRARADMASERLRKYQTANNTTFLAATNVQPEEDPGSHRRPPPAVLRAAGDARPPGLVGVEDQRDRIVEVLLSREAEDEKELKAVAIVGDEGAGKTTLAHEVYRAIGPRFDFRAWVSASSHRCWQDTLDEIARQIDGGGADPPRGGAGDDDRWIIRRSLEHKRYLIVLDDADHNKWRFVGGDDDLPANRLGSRVILTTRRDSVFHTPWTSSSNWTPSVHRISPLTPEDSRILFHRRIFGSKDGRCPPESVDVAGKILKKCGGAPLAVAVMSGLLANKPCSRSVWEGVDRSIGYISSEGTETTKNICLLGYYALPHHLKTCLLHLRLRLGKQGLGGNRAENP